MSLQERLRGEIAEACNDCFLPSYATDCVEAAAELDRLQASERSAWNAAVERDERIDRLQARVAELEVDAERLDYLESLMERREFQNARRPNEPLKSDLHIDLGRATLYERNLFGVATSIGEGETVRAAIDTARKAKS